VTGLPAAVERYLARRCLPGPWSLAGALERRYAGAVVIPSLAEGDSLFATLESLAANPTAWFERFLVVVVINQAEDADEACRRQNLADLARLQGGVTPGLPLAWVDAAAPGFGLPPGRAGVGLARKLGLDLALSCLDWAGEPLLVCLDADTLVEDNYLEAISAHFRHSTCGAATLAYRHQAAPSAELQAAIDRYELFLRSYVLGLRLAGSPYAFDSVGSTIACRATAYLRCGGMNSRKAGEDFYFLQQLAKVDGVAPLPGTTVMPASRVSARVPFGTGRSMGRLMAGEEEAVLCYPVEAFRVLAAWLRCVAERPDDDAPALLERAGAVSPVLADYLAQQGWLEAWSGLLSNHLQNERRLAAFHGWFDGFRSMRLIHRLCETGSPRRPPEEALPGYFAWLGRPCPAGVAALLAELRRLA
jgi:hypothetical protein